MTTPVVMDSYRKPMARGSLVIGSILTFLLLLLTPQRAPAIPAAASTTIQLDSISLTPLTRGLRVDIVADARIETYDAFILRNPARIVFDIPGVQGSESGTKTVETDSTFASRVRYFLHPDKLRLVIDTKESLLANYDARPFSRGLQIYVGEESPVITEAEGVSRSEIPTGTQTSDPASSASMVAEQPAVHREDLAALPTIRAPRVDEERLTVDGKLDEPAWSGAPVAKDFVQILPNEGRPASEASEVRVLFGETALYVGFRAFDRKPSAIEAQLTRRDQMSYSDWVMVQIDSFLDRRTAFQFEVNPRGVKRDSYLFDDVHRDSDWDAVWDVGTAIDKQGWTAEFRIPYSQLRFARAGKQTWGVQFARSIARLGEYSAWAPRSVRDHAIVSKFGILAGKDEIKRPRRLEIMPYGLARLQRAPGDSANPLHEENDFSTDFGIDLKYGVTGRLTLDMTVNPDFGQVEADPSDVNLSDVETFFPERRPFFLEGANIFNYVFAMGGGVIPDDTLFYSRRIGRVPRGWADPCEGFEGDPIPCIGYAEAPDTTTIQIAEKLSGKTEGGWSIGLLHAATAEETAHVINNKGIDSEAVIEPATNYGLVRLQKDFRGGKSALGFIATGVYRSEDEADALNLHTSAVTGGLDFRHRFWDDNYQISGFLLGSKVSGSEETIALTQQAPARYMHRPDVDHVTFDPTRTSLSGVNYSLDVSKMGGGFLMYGAGMRSRDPEFEANDLGFMQRADFKTGWIWLGYNRFLPTKHLRNWNLNTSIFHDADHDFNRTGYGGRINANLMFHNYWNIWGGMNYNADMVSTGALRGGPAIRVGDMFGVWGGFNTDGRKKLQFNVNLNYSSQLDSGSTSYSISPSLFYRPMGRLQLSVGGFYAKNDFDSQWVDYWWINQATPESNAYVFSRISQETIGMTGRLDLAFTTNLSLQLYLQPFVSAGRYDRFKQVSDPKADSYDDRFTDLDTFHYVDEAASIDGYVATVDTEGSTVFISNPDFNFKQFRSNAVLRWEYRPGSVLFVVWSQGREHYDQIGKLDVGDDLGELFGSASDDVFMVKVRHWL